MALGGIAVDGKGRLFVSNINQIFVTDQNGKPLGNFDTNQAFGMAFTDAGDLFVASRPFVVKYKVQN
jgi:hypothetical protein